MYCYNDSVIESEVQSGIPFVAAAFVATTTFAGQCPDGYKCKTSATIAYMNIVWTAGANNYLCKTGQYCDNTKVAGTITGTIATE